MAKQTTSKTKKAPKAKESVKWFDHARGLPLVLLHTTVGPIIGRTEKTPRPEHAGHWDYNVSFSLRMWAPAAVRMGLMSGQPGVLVSDARYLVTFQPLSLVETYIDLSDATPFGRSPVPDALVAAYEEYFEKVVAGEYSLNRVAVQVAQAQPHASEVPAMEFPWPAGSDPHTWLTRKVYDLGDDEAIDRDDPRRVLVKRAFFGWAYNATAEKVAGSFGLDLSYVRSAYDTIDRVFLSIVDREKVRAFLNPQAVEDAEPDDDENAARPPDETDAS